MDLAGTTWTGQPLTAAAGAFLPPPGLISI